MFNPFGGGGFVQPAVAPPVEVAKPAITLEMILEEMGIWVTERDITLINPAVMVGYTALLDDALARWAGHPVLNPTWARVKDFEMQYFRCAFRFFPGDTGLLCMFVNKQTGAKMVSSVDLWPRSDYATILVELSKL